MKLLANSLVLVLVIFSVYPVAAFAGALRHVVHARKVIDNPGKTQVTLNIVVSGDITKDALTALLRKLHDATAKERGFKYHSSPTHIAIYAFTSRAHAESGMGQWIAMLLQLGDKKEPEFQFNETQLVALTAPHETKFGLTEKVRQQVWEDIVRAEDRARREAERQHPEPQPGSPGWSREAFMAVLKRQETLRRRLDEKYKAEVVRKYNLSIKQLSEISVEGLKKNWPFPK